MDSQETLSFARKLMREFWEPYDSEAVSRFYHRVWSATIASSA
jgi:hypothetical protein